MAIVKPSTFSADVEMPVMPKKAISTDDPDTILGFAVEDYVRQDFQQSEAIIDGATAVMEKPD